MGRYIIKIKDRYFDWSTIVDAPITNGMTAEEFEKYHRKEYGEGYHDRAFSRRMELTEKSGTSAIGQDLDWLLLLNRAGDQESEISKEEIYRRYR